MCRRASVVIVVDDTSDCGLDLTMNVVGDVAMEIGGVVMVIIGSGRRYKSGSTGVQPVPGWDDTMGNFTGIETIMSSVTEVHD